jgi:hypothetical protein
MSDDLVKRLRRINQHYDLARGVHQDIRAAADRIEELEANSHKAFALEDALKLEPIRAALAILQQMAFELNRELFGEPADAEPEMREMLAKINSAFADLHVRKQ